MLIKATQKYTRQSPRKVRLIANTVKKLPLEKALGQLSVIEKRATMVVTQVVKQAVANAMNNHGYEFADLTLDSILVNEGPRYRRIRAVSRGRAHGVIKRTCHITVILKAEQAGEKLAPVKEVKAKAEAKTEVKEVAAKTAEVEKTKEPKKVKAVATKKVQK